MQPAGLYKFADDALIDAVLVSPFFGKATGQGGVLNHVVPNGMVVIDVGIKHVGDKAGDFNVQSYNLFMCALDAKVKSHSFTTRGFSPWQDECPFVCHEGD